MSESWAKRILRRVRLARRIFEVHWFQPATALWRTLETEIVLETMRGEGTGLDLGCGDGTLAPVLFSNLNGSVQWTGMDLEAREVRIARRASAHRHHYCASADALPEQDASYDLVFANSALEHMPHLDQVVTEIARTLKPGGGFVLTVPSASFHRCLFWPRFLRALGMARLARSYERHLDRRLQHLNYLTLEQWRDLLARHGFTTRKARTYLSRRACGWWETLANCTGGGAYALQLGRRSPRDLQHAAGLAVRRSRLLGGVAFACLLPVVVWVSSERPSQEGGALYIEAVKSG